MCVYVCIYKYIYIYIYIYIYQALGAKLSIYLSYTQKRSIIIRKCFDHKPTFQHQTKTQNDESSAKNMIT